MWPWSATALKEQLDRIERNQLRIAIALKINDQLEPPLGVPEKIAPRAPRRKLTEADVHFAGVPMPSQAALPKLPLPAPGQRPPPAAPASTLVDLEGAEPIINLPSNLPLASSAPERPSQAPPSPLRGQVMHWRDSGSLPQDLP